MTDTITEGDMRAQRRVAVPAALAAAVALAVPAVAQAKIVPGQSVAGVSLGDTAAKVKRVLGTPDRGSNVLNYRYLKRHGLGVYFVGGRVLEITVLRKPQATANGVRVGTPRATLVRKFPKARCAPAVVGRNAFECRLPGRFRGRTTETVFTTKNKKVASITVRFA